MSSTTIGDNSLKSQISATNSVNQQQVQQQQSPRNVAQPNNSGTAVKIALVDVSKVLQDGDKFIKWDEDSGIGVPVTLRVDRKGFYLHWIDQNHEMDLLDISTIRDVRTGQYAKKPRDTKLRQIVTMGSQDTLEEKTVTICYGADFVNVMFINFCCTRKEIAQIWSDELLKLAYNLTQLNGSTAMFLQKTHTKLCLQIDKTGKIPVKNIIKQFASNKDDKRRVEKALDVSGLPSGKGDSLPIAKFQFEDFYNLYKNLTQRTEVEKIFDELVGTSKRHLMSTTQLVDFLNNTQRDPRLNEILYPYANTARARDIIQEYEPNKFNAQKGQLSFDGFLRYLMSDDNPVMAISKLDLCDDMDQPLAHYFINSSHNTYLTGHQLTGKSSVEIYRQSLLAGCRCVELDFWNGRTEEPVIVHGYTFVPEIYAKDVLEAIAESAFKTSEFPVILSFENHCNPRQQAKIANYCRDIFGEMLLDRPLDSHPLESGIQLPTPAMLKRKIIIKNKKKHHHHHHKKGAATNAIVANTMAINSTGNTNSLQQQQALIMQQQLSQQNDEGATGGSGSPNIPTGNGDLPPTQHAPLLQQIRQSSKDSTGSSDTDSSSDDESMPCAPADIPSGSADQPNKVPKETEAGAEISALVNYVQPVHFSSFENSEKKGRFYEMSSFDEKQATTLLKERPIEFVNYNKHQLSRVYPAGTRFDSSNFMPQLFWNAGCQLVALNYQTLDLAMQLNLGIFEYNHRCGYILKPEFMRRKDRRLDPFAESTVDGIIAGTVSINVISGQFISDKKVASYIEVDMFGLPADTVRKKFRTKLIRDNAINPVYGEEPFVFKKVVLPELASIRIAAYEESGKIIGHRVLPVIGLCPGYRHVALRNEIGQPLPMATLFLCIVVKDYVPDTLSELAEALANPIKYQSELEKRSEQLAVLQEDTELTTDDNDITSTCPKKEVRTLEPTLSNSPKHRTSSISMHSAKGNTSSTDHGNDSQNDSFGATSNSMFTHQQSIDQQRTVDQMRLQQQHIQQQQEHRLQQIDHQNEARDIVAEPLDKILDNKLIREKRETMEKKLKSLKKNHDKEKMKVITQKCGDLSDKKSKFYMGNKLVKRLSSKNMDMNVQLPPCPTEPGETSSQEERLFQICREHAGMYKEIFEKYHESVYVIAADILQKSQERQVKQLKALFERETSDVMRQLQLSRKNEVKQLALVHKDKDELERMKREVDSTLVEKGVAERVRLTDTYNKRSDELQRQHEHVKAALTDHKTKAKAIVEKEYESRTCISDYIILYFNLGCSTSDSHNNSSSSLRNSSSVSNTPMKMEL